MLATCDDSLEGLRDRALLCFAFASGGRRRSEIAAADLRDLRKVGDDGYISAGVLEDPAGGGDGGFDAGQADPGAQRGGTGGLARGRGHRRRGDLPPYLEGTGRPCLAPGLGGRDREAPGPLGGVGGRLWGAQSAVGVCEGWRGPDAFTCPFGLLTQKQANFLTMPIGLENDPDVERALAWMHHVAGPDLVRRIEGAKEHFSRARLPPAGSMLWPDPMDLLPLGDLPAGMLVQGHALIRDRRFFDECPSPIGSG